MPITQFVFIRHGETEWNRAKKLQGWRDSRLTTLGKKQLVKTDYAALHAELIQCHKTAQRGALYCSDLGRAMASARLVAKQIDYHVIADKRLRERNLGELEGKIGADIPDDYQHRFKRPLGQRFNIESDVAFEQRVLDWLQLMVRRHPSQTVWVVSHGEWLRTARNLIEGREAWRWGNGIPANGEPVLIKMQSAQ